MQSFWGRTNPLLIVILKDDALLACLLMVLHVLVKSVIDGNSCLTFSALELSIFNNVNNFFFLQSFVGFFLLILVNK